MKTLIKKILIILIAIAMIIPFINVSFAYEPEDIELYTKVKSFLNEISNKIFLMYDFESVNEVPIDDDGIVNFVEQTTIDLSNEEIRNIVGTETEEDMIYAFKKADMNTFLQSKLGIDFEDLDEYNSFENNHTTTNVKDVYYGIKDDVLYPTFDIGNMETLTNGNIEVLVDLGFECKIVTLRPNNESYTFVSCVTQVNDERTDIKAFIESNPILAYYNYDKVQDIIIDCELLSIIPGKSKVSEEQQKNSEIYDMMKGMDESYYISRDKVNLYLQNKIGITVDKLKNYEDLLKYTTTSDDKDNFYFFIVTGPTSFSNIVITEVKDLGNNYYEVNIVGEADGDEFSNTIKLVKVGDSYNYISSKSADGVEKKNSVNSSDNYFNYKGKEIKKDTQDVTTAKGTIPQTGEIVAISVSTIAVLAIGAVVFFIKYRNIDK